MSEQIFKTADGTIIKTDPTAKMQWTPGMADAEFNAGNPGISQDKVDAIKARERWENELLIWAVVNKQTGAISYKKSPRYAMEELVNSNLALEVKKGDKDYRQALSYAHGRDPITFEEVAFDGFKYLPAKNITQRHNDKLFAELQVLMDGTKPSDLKSIPVVTQKPTGGGNALSPVRA